MPGLPHTPHHTTPPQSHAQRRTQWLAHRKHPTTAQQYAYSILAMKSRTWGQISGALHLVGPLPQRSPTTPACTSTAVEPPPAASRKRKQVPGLCVETARQHNGRTLALASGCAAREGGLQHRKTRACAIVHQTRHDASDVRFCDSASVTTCSERCPIAWAVPSHK
jgi:hypothetical protein